MTDASVVMPDVHYDPHTEGVSIPNQVVGDLSAPCALDRWVSDHGTGIFPRNKSEPQSYSLGCDR
jgi:hypothetical protein